MKRLFFFELCRCKARRLLLVFREKQLRDYVRQPAVMLFLKAYGYHDQMSIMEMLEHLRYRMEVSIEFSNEIGIFRLPIKGCEMFYFLSWWRDTECAESGRFLPDVVNAQRSFLVLQSMS